MFTEDEMVDFEQSVDRLPCLKPIQACPICCYCQAYKGYGTDFLFSEVSCQVWEMGC